MTCLTTRGMTTTRFLMRADSITRDGVTPAARAAARRRRDSW